MLSELEELLQLLETHVPNVLLLLHDSFGLRVKTSTFNPTTFRGTIDAFVVGSHLDHPLRR